MADSKRTEQCGGCRFWEATGEESTLQPGIRIGWCKRLPPPLPPRDGEETSDWPQTWQDNWCGEWMEAGGPSPAPAADVAEKRPRQWWRSKAGLSVRALNAIIGLLRRAGSSAEAWSAADVAGLTEDDLELAKGCGPETLKEIIRWLAARGLSLRAGRDAD